MQMQQKQQDWSPWNAGRTTSCPLSDLGRLFLTFHHPGASRHGSPVVRRQVLPARVRQRALSMLYEDNSDRAIDMEVLQKRIRSLRRGHSNEISSNFQIKESAPEQSEQDFNGALGPVQTFFYALCWMWVFVSCAPELGRLDYGESVQKLRFSDLPKILRKEPNWNVFATNFRAVDRMDLERSSSKDPYMVDAILDLDSTKILLEFVREISKGLVKFDDVVIYFDRLTSLLVAELHIRLGNFKFESLTNWEKHSHIDIVGDVSFHFDENFQIDYAIVGSWLVNGRRINENWPDVVLSDSLTTNVEKVRRWAKNVHRLQPVDPQQVKSMLKQRFRFWEDFLELVGMRAATLQEKELLPIKIFVTTLSWMYAAELGVVAVLWFFCFPRLASIG